MAWLDAIKEFLGSGGNMVVANIGAIVIGYILGTVIPPKIISDFLISLVVKLPFPVVIKVELLFFIDKLVGQIGKDIPDTKDEIKQKWFS